MDSPFEDRIVVSRSGGTLLSVIGGQWVLTDGSEHRPIADAMYGVLPLLERSPDDGLKAVKTLDGPRFPFAELLLTALSSNSGYWQGKAIPWLAELQVEPTGAIADAAMTALAMKRASQQDRHCLRRWLDGKPIYRG